MDSIYLDNNATTPLLPEVAEAIRLALGKGYANPSSQHEPGRRARRDLEDCREQIAEILGAHTTGRAPDRVVFTSGGTESNNLAILGLADRDGPSRAGCPTACLIYSAIEHPSVKMAAADLGAKGWVVDTLPADTSGVVQYEDLAERLHSGVRLVSVMLGNNETGVIQPVAHVAEFCRSFGVMSHTDAAQAVGKIPVSFRELGVDALTCTAHKLHGPRGIGLLLLRGGIPIKPLMYGGFQQAGIRPGTESVVLAVGFCKALELWHNEQQERTARLTALRDRFELAILRGYADAVIIGHAAPRLPHTSNIALVGVDRQALQMALDLAGVACSTGSACASGASEASPVLRAMGCPEDVVNSSLRFSLSALTTSREIDQAAERIVLTCKKLRRS